MNVIYVLATQKYDSARRELGRRLLTSVSAALTGRIHAADNALVEGVFLGPVARLLSAFAALPSIKTLATHFLWGRPLPSPSQGGSMLNFVWTPQVASSALPASAPGQLDLDNFERHHFRVEFATPRSDVGSVVPTFAPWRREAGYRRGRLSAAICSLSFGRFSRQMSARLQMQDEPPRWKFPCGRDLSRDKMLN